MDERKTGRPGQPGSDADPMVDVIPLLEYHLLLLIPKSNLHLTFLLTKKVHA
jgi:hypothetical protein